MLEHSSFYLGNTCAKFVYSLGMTSGKSTVLPTHRSVRAEHPVGKARSFTRNLTQLVRVAIHMLWSCISPVCRLSIPTIHKAYNKPLQIT